MTMRYLQLFIKFLKFHIRWLAVGLLSGCTLISMPEYQQTQSLSPPIPLENSLEESLETDFFAVGDWPQANWWEMFESVELNHLIESALARNPSLAEAESRIEVAWQIAKIARSRLFPWIFFKVTDEWEHISKNGLYRAFNPKLPLNANLIDIDFTLNFDIDFWGKYHQLFYAAIGRKKAQEAEAAEVSLVIATSLARAFFALKTNLIKKTLYEELHAIFYETLALQNQLKQSALLSSLPSLFTQENVFETQKIVDRLEGEIATNKHLINVLAGWGPDTVLDVDASLALLPERLCVPCDLSAGLLARRPDLMAQIWRAAALAHEVGAAMADFYPDINLSAFVGLESLKVKHLFDASSITADVKPALSLPIFTAGAISANVLTKKAEFDAAIFEYNQKLLTSAQEVADALSLGKSVFKQKEEQQSILESAEGLVTLTDVRRKAGLDSLFDSFLVLQELILKKIEDVELTYMQYIVTVQLIEALGGGFFAEQIPLAKEVCSNE
jgi:NodT family efflux transporter outer membrane factor (OMF) lipoprotein